MKLFAIPDHLPAPVPDYGNYDPQVEQAKESEHLEALKAHLIELGYVGAYTGEIYRDQIADGYAQYMVADSGGRQFGLVHLPYGDGYASRDVAFLPKREIIARLEQQRRVAALFSRKSA